jgi:hypothetical protein
VRFSLPGSVLTGNYLGKEMRRIAKAHVDDHFNSVGARARDEIAHAVARQFPKFARRLQPKYGAREPQQEAMALVNATALGTTYSRN